MSRTLLERAREFRRNPTRSEALLWDALRGRALGVRVYRQKVIGRFIPDFVIERPRLVIELDGDVHRETTGRDAERDAWLAERGYRVIRITSADCERDVDAVVDRIAAEVRALSKPPKKNPRKGDPP